MNQADINNNADLKAREAMSELIRNMHKSGATAVVKKIIIKNLIKRLLDEEIN